MSTIYKDKNITKMYYGSKPVYSFYVEDGGGTSSGLDFSLIGYDTELTKQINDVYNADIAYSKQLYDEWNSATTTAYNLYYNNKKIKFAPAIDLTNVTTTKQMFYQCSNLFSVPNILSINNKNMASMFYYCIQLEKIGEIRTDLVTDMSQTFYQCEKLKEIPPLQTSNVTTFLACFQYCESLETIPEIDTSNATTVARLFSHCVNLKSLPHLDLGNLASSSPTIFDSTTYQYLTDLDGFPNLKVSLPSNFLDKVPQASVDSLMNVINGLWDWTDYPDGNAPLNNGRIYNFGTTHTLKFGQTNLDKLTAEQVAIATAKGWTLTA